MIQEGGWPPVGRQGAGDLRSVDGLLPWPNVRGKRCLDLGTTDGYLAFEMERRGASEVVALHLDGPAPPATASATSAPFRVAAEMLGSRVEWRSGDLALLELEAVGSFDVVACGRLLTRVPDPVATLRAAHRVTAGMLLSIEEIDLWLSVVARGKPLLTFQGASRFGFNGAAHKRVLQAAGFAVERVSGPFVLPGGEPSGSGWKSRLDALATRIVTRSSAAGDLHRALLARAERA